MGPELMIISAGLKLVQGIQGYQQNNAMAKAASQAAAANMQNEQNRLVIEQDRARKQIEKSRGTARVASAATGATLGSFDDVMGESTEASLMDMALLEYDSKLRQENYRYSGAMQKAEYKQAAKSSLIEGITGSAGTGVKAFSNYSTLGPGEYIRWNQSSRVGAQ